jgi:hypothetical protein
MGAPLYNAWMRAIMPPPKSSLHAFREVLFRILNTPGCLQCDNEQVHAEIMKMCEEFNNEYTEKKEARKADDQDTEKSVDREEMEKRMNKDNAFYHINVTKNTYGIQATFEVCCYLDLNEEDVVCNDLAKNSIEQTLPEMQKALGLKKSDMYAISDVKAGSIKKNSFTDQSNQFFVMGRVQKDQFCDLIYVETNANYRAVPKNLHFGKFKNFRWCKCKMKISVFPMRDIGSVGDRCLMFQKACFELLDSECMWDVYKTYLWPHIHFPAVTFDELYNVVDSWIRDRVLPKLDTAEKRRVLYDRSLREAAYRRKLVPKQSKKARVGGEKKPSEIVGVMCGKCRLPLVFANWKWEF